MHYIHRDESALYYECGFSSDNAIFLRLGEEAWFITDSRYTVEAKEAVRGAEVVEAADLLAALRGILRRHHARRLAYDPKEWDAATIGRLEAKLPGLYFAKVPDLSHRRRIVKRPDEISLLKEAARLGREGFDAFARYLESEGLGRSEKRLHFACEGAMRFEGEYALSFDPIVAIGPNAAKPHALPTDTTLRKGALLLVDAGLKYRRYCSDRTRTIHVGDTLHFGDEQRFDSPKIQKAYDLVRKAHDTAIAKARSGMTGAEIDRLAREVIEKGGMGEAFVHSTGHGVGLDIHEMPYISKRGATVVEDGMVFTIEPGIYIPGEFGIRIEDMVVMRDGRAEVL
ncbi:M24 family metallopeptidase [Hydrogenimonas sp.]